MNNQVIELSKSSTICKFQNQCKLYIFAITILITIYLLTIKSNRIQQISSGFSKNSVDNQLVNDISDGDIVPTPCIEPHCETECYVLYPNYRSIDNLNESVTSEEEKEHILIDAGLDKTVNDMISNYPNPKSCPYRLSNSDKLKNETNPKVEYYPLSFGFIEHYLFKTIHKTVRINNREYRIEQTCIPIKSIAFSSLIPGVIETYQFHFGEELEYRRMYSVSFFAVTMKKGGWDCNRHYEILSAGTVPYFDRLESAGLYMMAHLPKTLLFEARAMAGVNRTNLTINFEKFNVTQYRLILHRLIYYSKHRLTTRKLVEYILRSVNYPMNHNHSILFIAPEQVDYMTVFMLHGFTLIFGKNVTVYGHLPYMYTYSKNQPWKPEASRMYYRQRLYGLGFGYALSLKKYAKLYDQNKHIWNNESMVKKNIETNQYSLIVYGSILRKNDLFALVTQYYHKSRIIAIDGEDESRRPERANYARQSTYFLREIPDNCNAFS